MKFLTVKTYLFLAVVIVFTSNYSLEAKTYLTPTGRKGMFPTADKFEWKTHRTAMKSKRFMTPVV